MAVNLPLFVYTKAETCSTLSWLQLNASHRPLYPQEEPRSLEDNTHYYQNNPRMRWSTNRKRVKRNGIHTEVKQRDDGGDLGVYRTRRIISKTTFKKQ